MMHLTWGNFLKETAYKFTRPLLKEAALYVREKDLAVDLGAGAMNDASYLVSEGFAKVIAVDSNPGVIEYAKDIPNLEVKIARYEDYIFPELKYDLVTAQYALPFCSPESFDAVIDSIKKSLKKGGIFTGQFFGTEDDWSSNPNMTFHTENQVKDLLKDMKIHVFREEKKVGKTATEAEKNWHVFHVIAEKI